MRRIQDRLTEAADHLALDEALLMEAEEGRGGEALRVWEFAEHVVIAGRSTRVTHEIDHPFCESRGIQILRRCTGGASIVAGPGCLMYSVILSLARDPSLSRIDVAHQFVMGRLLTALRHQNPEVALQGTCDLTWKNRKFSGNSLRIARQHLLYHGTILYDFDLGLMSKCLRQAPRQPEYRRGRDHPDFLINMPIDRIMFSSGLDDAFEVIGQQNSESYRPQMHALRQRRYNDRKWNFRH